MDDLRTLVGPGFDEMLEEGYMEEFGTDDPWLTSRLYEKQLLSMKNSYYGDINVKEVSTEIDLDRDMPEYLGDM
jgi:hypothetical protein